MIISLVVAAAENGVIGKNGGLPWRLPADLKFFKALTTGHTVIMGRKTLDEIKSPLPNRRNIVISRTPKLQVAGVERAGSLDEAFALGIGETEVFVIGGAEIYRLALPRADRVYLTRVHAQVDGDTKFPSMVESDWTLAHDERHEADQHHAFAYSFRRYDRRQPVASNGG